MTNDKIEDLATQDAGPQPPEQTPEPEVELEHGYVVGLDKDGKFVFQLLGKKSGLVELLGIHQYANRQVDRLVDSQMNNNSAFVSNLVEQCYRDLKQTLSKIQDSLGTSKE